MNLTQAETDRGDFLVPDWLAVKLDEIAPPPAELDELDDTDEAAWWAEDFEIQTTADRVERPWS